MSCEEEQVQRKLVPPGISADPAGGRAHPAEKDLERFFRGALTRAEVRSVVRHLLAGCERCAGVTRELWSFGDEALEDLGRYERPGNQRRGGRS
jgi:hypothetical protein